jgi:hypothetical protein
MAEKKKDFKTTREGQVKIKHPGIEQLGECLPESLEVWMDAGWVPVDPDDKGKTSIAAVNEVNTSGQRIVGEVEDRPEPKASAATNEKK